MTTQNERSTQKKTEIIAVMNKYKDEYGNIDLSKLRKEDGATYNKISYHFDTIDKALIAAGAANSGQAKDLAKGAPVNRKTLRNELAYDMLVELRSKHTLEAIATRYGCSRAHINQLFQSLQSSIGSSREIETDLKVIEK